MAVVYLSRIQVGRGNLGCWCESGAHVLICEPRNYRSKSATAILIAGCLLFCRFCFFFLVAQFPHFGFLFFFRRFVRFLHRFKTSKHMQNEKKQNRFGGRKMQPAIILEKTVMLHALEHAGIFR